MKSNRVDYEHRMSEILYKAIFIASFFVTGQMVAQFQLPAPFQIARYLSASKAD